jgi:hypothetical protein
MAKRKKRLRMRRAFVRRLKVAWAFGRMLVTFHIYLVHVPLNDMEMLSLRASDRRYKRYLEWATDQPDAALITGFRVEADDLLFIHA